MGERWRDALCGSIFLSLAAGVGCEGAGGGALLGPGGPSIGLATTGSPNGAAGEGLTLGADPETIVLDPCDPQAPTDPGSGKLLGTSAITAYLLDADLRPLVGVEVTFSTSAGVLSSMGQPVLTDANGRATDTLSVTEDETGDVEVSAQGGGFEEAVSIPVSRLAEPPITLELQPAVLWPPNHEMREVHAVFAGLDCGPAPTIELVSVTSSEPDDGPGDGNTEGDVEIDIDGVTAGVADLAFRLRAERAGNGPGRTYTATYRLIGEDGTESLLEGTALVPHDQGH